MPQKELEDVIQMIDSAEALINKSDSDDRSEGTSHDPQHLQDTHEQVFFSAGGGRPYSLLQESNCTRVSMTYGLDAGV